MEETNVTFTCDTRGTIAYWVLNDTTVSITHPEEQPRYERMGVTFGKNEYDGYINLTLIAPAVVALNNTKISCTVYKNGPAMSTSVYLYVFNTLGKHNYTTVYLPNASELF